MIEKVLTGIAFVALCALFYFMLWAANSSCIKEVIVPLIGIVVSGAVVVYVSNSIEYDDDTE